MNRFIVFVLTAIVLASFGVAAASAVHVRGYYRKDGTYVQPHERSSPSGGSSHSTSYVRDYTPPPAEPRTEYRTTSRSTAREVPRYGYPTPAESKSSHGEFATSLQLSGENPPKPTLQLDSQPALQAPTPKYPFRHWTDNTGKFSTYARLVSVIGQHVKLAREDDQAIDVTMEHLSNEDNVYLKHLLHIPIAH